MRLFIFVLLLVAAHSLKAQQPDNGFSLRGRFFGKGVALDRLPISIFSAETGKLVKTEFSASDGSFEFIGLKKGSYRIEVSTLAIEKFQSKVLVINRSTVVPDMEIRPKEHFLKEVNVQAERPAVQYQYGKIILNVGGSISAVGSTAMDVLEKAPGIQIDQNDNISIRGKQGVMVMMDGKRVPMSGAELASLLKGTSSDQVDKIEIITNPSAKYEAQGNAGIIDIRLKKDSRLGTNGTLTGSLGQGKFSKLASGGTINTRKKNLNIFAGYNYGHRKDYIAIEFYRRFFDQGLLSGIFRQDNLMYNIFDVHNYRAGADYNIGKSTVIGLVYTGLDSRVAKLSDNRSNAFSAQDVFASSFSTNSDNLAKRNVGSYNVNLKHNFQDKGHELSADADYARFATHDLQDYLTRYYRQDGSPGKANYRLTGDLSGVLEVKSVKADYIRPIKGGLVMELGAKSSLVKSDNNVQFFDDSFASGSKLDTSKSNHFLYDETIHSGYVSGNKSWKKFDVQFGLRLEATVANGLQLKDGSRFDRDYVQLFPNVYVGYKLSEKHQLGFGLSRRINRPTYNQLNPFKIFLDTTTYVTGNPYLKPELTNALELSYIINNKYITKLGFSRTRDNIITVLAPDPKQNNVIAQSSQNLASLNFVSLNITIPISVGKWLTSTNNLLSYYGRYSGNLANTNLNNGRVSFNVNTNNQIKFSSSLSGELIGSYNSSNVTGFLNIEPLYTFSVGVQKLILKKQGSLKLNVSDVLNSNTLFGTTNLTGYREEFNKRQDTRVGTVSFSYRFGSSKVGAARRRTSGAEEEKRRAGGS